MIILGNRFKKFTYTGSTQYFTVPANVTTIYVSACGGGGGGCYGYTAPGPSAGFNNGSGGGATSMGVFPSILFTLAGGGGGGSTDGASGGFGSDSGTSINMSGSRIYGLGGASIFGPKNSGYGSGGDGGWDGGFAGVFGAGGGGGACYYKQAVTVVPGTTYPITIGAGGAAGANIAGGKSAVAGSNGFVFIEW